MGKTSKWLKSILTGKKEKDKGGINLSSPAPIENTTIPIAITTTTTKEKKRWSFRRSAAANTGTAAAAKKDVNSGEAIPTTPQPVVQNTLDPENEQKKHAMVMEAATAAAADVATAAAQAAAAVTEITAAAKRRSSIVQELAAIKIQSVFRSFLARKALCALKGLVKLQSLIRGHLVRRQATAALRRMEAMVSLQARARAQRIRMAGDETSPISKRQSVHRKSPHDNHYRQTYNETDRNMDENVKIVEMDFGESRTPSRARNSYSNHTQAAPSALTELSPRAYSGHFEEYSFDTNQSSPQYYSAMSKP